MSPSPHHTATARTGWAGDGLGAMHPRHDSADRQTDRHVHTAVEGQPKPGLMELTASGSAQSSCRGPWSSREAGDTGDTHSSCWVSVAWALRLNATPTFSCLYSLLCLFTDRIDF